MPLVRLAALATLVASIASIALAVERPRSSEPAPFVYTSRASGNSDLWLRDGTDHSARNLTNHPAQDHSASWFPAGDRVAYQSTRDGQREIFVIAIDGSEPTNLTRHPAHDLLPDVSPDGRRIAFFSDRGIEHDPRSLPGNLYIMASDGGAPTRVTRTPLTSTFGPDWAPNGAALLFARDFEGDLDLVLLDLDTGSETRLPGTAAAEYGGRFSPDGRRIALHAGLESGEARIVVVNVDGSERRELTSGGQHYNPHWSPDGTRIAFTGAPLGSAEFDLMVVPASGGPVEPLVATDDDERSGSWSPRPSPLAPDLNVKAR